MDEQGANEMDEETLANVDGIPSPVSEENEHAHVEVVKEYYEGGPYWYLLASAFWTDDAGNDDGTYVRVDLDRDGWQRLKELCDVAIADMEAQP